MTHRAGAMQLQSAINSNISDINPYYNDHIIVNATALGKGQKNFYLEFAIGIEISRDPEVVNYLIEKMASGGAI